jgi:pimeloyl-ACP methyl ester carboxylesterase
MGAETYQPQPFEIAIEQSKLDDLQRRLRHINWPDDVDNEDWSYGTSRAYLLELIHYWQNDYDWRSQEARMNQYDHYKVAIDEVPIHFIYQKGVGRNPTPLILTHGWPWTFWDFHQVIGPLTDPAAHGGNPEDAFDVVVPSLPGFGFSTPLRRTGIHWASTADLWVKLMHGTLGYERFAAHGGDWGALVTGQLGHKYPEHVLGIHLTNAFPMPGLDPDRPWSISALTIPQETALSEEQRQGVLAWERKFSAHMAVQALGPQSLAYAMHDSPLGLAAWLLERRHSWGDCRGDIEFRFSKEHLLNTTLLYWLTDSFVSTARYYHEAANFSWQPEHSDLPVVSVPTALSLFEHDLPPRPLDWTGSFYNLTSQKVYESGGHFGAAEEPEQVVLDIRAHFKALRG